MVSKNHIIKHFLEKGFLVSPDFVNEISENFNNKLFSNLKEKPIILNSDLNNLIEKGIDFGWEEFERNKVLSEKNKNNLNYKVLLEKINNPQEITKENFCEINEIKEYEGEGKVILLKNYKDKSKKREIGDFTSYFRNRFEAIKKILINRPELQNLVSINKLKFQQDGKQVAIMGLVYNKNETKTGNFIIELEDVSGIAKLIVNKNKKEVYDMAKDIVLDEVIGVIGISKDNILFVNDLILPDIPSNIELKKSPDEVYAVFIGDTHFGLNKFLEENFNKFIDWLNGKYGNESQKEISNKIKYLFITGDLVEGVGIYPNQDKDLAISDIYNQYKYAANFLSKIPKGIKIIICAGNHDSVRMSEPQPEFDIQFAKPIFDLKNVILVSNPSLINIHSSENFPGFNILLYHGFSLPYFAENVNSIRVSGGMEKVDLIMKFLLQRRHLAPTYSSNLSVPDICEDGLVIDKIPDIFVTGHIHKVNVSTYKNTICINSSCWVTQTDDMERRGIVPEPSKAIIFNLKTRDIKIMNFENEK